MNLAESRFRDLTIVAALSAMFAGLALCWVLTIGAEAPSTTSVPAVIAVGPAALLIGLGSLPTLGVEPSARVVAVIAAFWVIGATLTAWARTAEQVGTGIAEVGVADFSSVMSHGAPELIAAVCGLLVLAWAVLDLLTDVQIGSTAAVSVLAGLGLLAMAISGHAATHGFGPVLIGAHALAAGWWVGALAALILCVRGRSGWAIALPQFSDKAVWAVGVLACTGVVAGVLELSSVPELWTTGYGRILLAKTVGLVALMLIARRYRQSWVAAAGRHQVSENASIARAVGHVLLMAVVMGLAVGLSVTA